MANEVNLQISMWYFFSLNRTHMGVRRLFSRGGQNFPGGGGKNILGICLKSTKKQFFSKKVKNMLFCLAKGGGCKSPAPSYPADTHAHSLTLALSLSLTHTHQTQTHMLCMSKPLSLVSNFFRFSLFLKKVKNHRVWTRLSGVGRRLQYVMALEYK